MGSSAAEAARLKRSGSDADPSAFPMGSSAAAGRPKRSGSGVDPSGFPMGSLEVVAACSERSGSASRPSVFLEDRPAEASDRSVRSDSSMGCNEYRPGKADRADKPPGRARSESGH